MSSGRGWNDVCSTDFTVMIMLHKMTRKISRLGFAALVIVCLSACEPTGPFAGSRLAGEAVVVPESWRELNSVEVVQLETKGQYCVNLWGIGLDRHFYVASSRGPASKWAKRISLQSEVRLRVGSSLFELNAVVVTDVSELDLIAAGYKEKYDLNATVDFPEAVVYRLDRR